MLYYCQTVYWCGVHFAFHQSSSNPSWLLLCTVSAPELVCLCSWLFMYLTKWQSSMASQLSLAWGHNLTAAPAVCLLAVPHFPQPLPCCSVAVCTFCSYASSLRNSTCSSCALALCLIMLSCSFPFQNCLNFYLYLWLIWFKFEWGIFWGGSFYTIRTYNCLVTGPLPNTFQTRILENLQQSPAHLVSDLLAKCVCKSIKV